MKSANNEFVAFSSEIIDFFKDLKDNNNREWFAERKKFYDTNVKSVSEQFVSKMSELFAANNLPFLADKKLSLFRIYRDIRFSKNKDPYKTNMGAYFLYTPNYEKYHDKSMGIYFHIEPGQSFIAGGVYQSEPKPLRKIRERIYEEFDDFLAIINNPKFKNHFSRLFQTDKLKRAPVGFDSSHPSVEYLKLKDLTMYDLIDEDIICSKNLPEIMIEKSIALLPYLEFMFEAVDYEE